ncbi:NACHT domain-containing protein [Streptomyces nojiriensis]|uniref:NACHT domain-containing protein n=1 Tax=Streptomyces nojiriensis TaxID=66374 RepID=UPI0036DED0DE
MARLGGRRDRRWRVLLGTVGVSAVAASALIVGVPLASGGLDAVRTDALLALSLGVAALAVAVVKLRQPPAGDLARLARDWAATLAEQVKEDGQEQWRQLIGDDTQKINLTFTLRPEPGRVAVAPAGTGRLFEGTPDLPDVAAYYRQTCPRRLVVTGKPGAGKTVLALELVLALIEGREEGDPIPVRLSLAEWDTTIPLLEWLVSRLMAPPYDHPAKIAEELVRQRLVLPVLDGLDEMDPTAPGGAPSPDAPRARAALEALNTYQNGRAAGPVILTCRTRHYEALGGRVRLLDAARIDIDPVTPPTARAYLRQRAPDPARWRPVLEALEGDPTGALATTLSTPWRLCLAATVYARDGDPADLPRHATPADLDEYLLARFVPAATALHARPRRPYPVDDVRRWLSCLAAHLDTVSSAPGEPAGAGVGTRTDLVLHQLWPLAGPRRVRATDAVLTAFGILLPLTLAWAGLAWASHVVPLIVMGIGLAVMAGCYAARASVSPPARVHWGRLRTKAGCRDLAIGLAFGLVFGLVFGVMVGPVMWLAIALAAGVEVGRVAAQSGGLGYRLAFGLAVGVIVGLAAGIMRAIAREPSTGARPREVIRGDLSRGLAVGITCGLVFAPLFGLAAGLAVGLAVVLTTWATRAIRREPYMSTRSGDGIRSDLLRVLAFGLAFGCVVALVYGIVAGLYIGLRSGVGSMAELAIVIVCGFTVGLVVGFAFTAPVGRRYLVFVLCSRGTLPRRLGVFLDWACTAGLMRLAGTAYQFRHLELQQWLARHPGPPSV